MSITKEQKEYKESLREVGEVQIHMSSQTYYSDYKRRSELSLQQQQFIM